MAGASAVALSRCRGKSRDVEEEECRVCFLEVTGPKNWKTPETDDQRDRSSNRGRSA
jgi:hypothetical protein